MKCTSSRMLAAGLAAGITLGTALLVGGESSAGAVSPAAISPAAGPAALPTSILPTRTEPTRICTPPRVWDPVDEVCVLPPRTSPTSAPPPANNPFGSVDSAIETTSGDEVHVTGWAADADEATSAIDVRITIDGKTALTTTADLSRPDIGSAHPGFGANHGFDVLVPEQHGAHTVCAVGINVGSGQDSQLQCRSMDEVTGFIANSISYDTADAVVHPLGLDQVIPMCVTNNGNVKQVSHLIGTKTLVQTHGWTDTQTVKLTIGGTISASFFGLANGSTTITAEGDLSFTQNGSEAVTTTLTFQGDVDVPASSKMCLTASAGREEIDMPYTLAGYFTYDSGAQVTGTEGGVYKGVASDDIDLVYNQYNLDGSKAQAPVRQAAPMLLRTVQTTMPGGFTAVPPSRLFDSRTTGTAVPATGSVAVQVTGQAGVPTTGVSAVVVNLTATGPTAPGNITAYADGGRQPNTSNLNFLTGQTQPNLAIVPVGADGKIRLSNNSAGTTHLIVDLAGYYLSEPVQ